MTGIITTLPPLIEQPPGNNASNPAGLPGYTYIFALLGLGQTWTAKQTFPLGNISLHAADVLDLAPSSTIDTTNASNITSGTLPAARLPTPTASTLGGVQSIAAVSHNWINSVSTSGVHTLSQPAFTDISGTALVTQGGTGAATFTANGVLLGNATSAFGITSVGATGSVLSGNTAAAPTFQTLSAVIDTVSSTRGSVLYRGASTWSALAPGTAGNVLTTHGAALDPTWGTGGRAVFNVVDYGADVTGGSDSTTAINNAIAAANAAGIISFGILNKSTAVFFPPGVYSVSSINCTRATGLNLTAWPGTMALYGSQQVSTSKPIVDFTGSSQCGASGIFVAGQTTAGADPAIIPSVGFLFAQSNLGVDSNKNFLRDCGSLGKFTVSSIYLYSSTDNIFYSSAFQQHQASGACLTVTGDNPAGITSPFTTIATGTNNAGDNSFFACEVHCMATTCTSATIKVSNADNLRFFGGNCANNAGPSQVNFAGTNRQLTFNGVKFYSDLGSPPTDCFYANNSAAQSLVISACNTQDNAFSANFISGTGVPDYTGGRISGIRAVSLTGLYLSNFAEAFPPFGSVAVNLVGPTTQFLAPGGNSTSEGNTMVPMGRSGVFTGMRVQTGGSPGGVQTYTFTLRKNGASTAITCVISAGATTASDTTHVVSYVAGDTFDVMAVPSATAANTGSVWATVGYIPG